MFDRETLIQSQAKYRSNIDYLRRTKELTDRHERALIVGLDLELIDKERIEPQVIDPTKRYL